jgi:long-chain acyl-CoA synthetase
MQTLSGALADRIRSLPERLSRVIIPWAEQTPDGVALREGERRMTYGQLNLAVEDTGRWLSGNGVRPGDRVMVVGENSIALAVLILAIGGVDAWPLVVNARISDREVDAIRAHSSARMQIFTTEVSGDAQRHAFRLGATIEAPARQKA